MLDHTVEDGNPADGPQLEPAIRRIHRRAVAADRGYDEARIETQLHDLGVEQIAIPRKGSPAQTADNMSNGRLPGAPQVAHRCEGRISHLKTATAGTAPA